MSEALELLERRTTTDVVFDALHDEIVTLKLLPGSKLSETDVSRRFGVSRQPVRDAFNRLANLDLMIIRPQKASEVRGFSMERIAHARFVRLAVELEVIWNACAVWDDERAGMLEHSLEAQEQAIKADQFETFHTLDQEFHKLICDLGGCPLAARTIAECKRKVDRLCMLSLGRSTEAAILLKDHRKLARALKKKSVDDSTAIVRQHMGRLDSTISEIRRDHSEYFE